MITRRRSRHRQNDIGKPIERVGTYRYVNIHHRYMRHYFPLFAKSGKLGRDKIRKLERLDAADSGGSVLAWNESVTSNRAVLQAD